MTLEYLFWQVREDQLSFAVDLDANALVDNNPTAGVVSPRNQDFFWDSGGRIGIHYFSPCSPVDFAVTGTIFQTHSFTVDDHSQGVVSTFIFQLPDAIIGTGAFSHWNLHLYALTADVGFSWNPVPAVFVHPRLGAMGAAVKQTQQVEYQGLNREDTPFFATVHRANDFIGAGPYLGFDLEYALFGSLHLVSRNSAALLFGRFHDKSKYLIGDASSGELVFTSPFIEEDLFRGRPFVSAYLGLAWDTCLFPPFSLQMSAGYEFQYWWQQWHAPTNVLDLRLSSIGGRWGDLLLHGLVISINVSL